MIDEREEKSRLKCPKCQAFIAEVIPRLDYGVEIVARCPKCHAEVKFKKERKTA